MVVVLTRELFFRFYDALQSPSPFWVSVDSELIWSFKSLPFLRVLWVLTLISPLEDVLGDPVGKGMSYRHRLS